MPRSEETGYTSIAKANLHDNISPLLRAAHSEMQELSKKKPDATLSSNKVKILNRLLTDAKTILKDEGTAKYLDLIDEEVELPHHSDVVLMLSQYCAALATFKSQYFGWSSPKAQDIWYVK